MFRLLVFETVTASAALFFFWYSVGWLGFIGLVIYIWRRMVEVFFEWEIVMARWYCSLAVLDCLQNQFGRFNLSTSLSLYLLSFHP